MIMSKVLKRRVKKAGMPPGSLVPLQEPLQDAIKISLVDYDSKKFVEKKEASLQDCLVYLDSPSITWINVCGIYDSKIIEKLGLHFGLHPLLLEDIMTAGQRSKLDNYKDAIFIVVRMLTYDEENHEVGDEQVSLVLGKNFLISFLESKKDVFAPVRERLHQTKSRLRQRGADYLCYTLIDFLVDNYFLILEKLDERLESLENELVHSPTPKTLLNIQKSKREITLLRKSVWPMREVISNFRRIDTPLIQDPTKLYIQDVYDHTIQAIDTIESFRDISSGMIDIYLSNINMHMNEIMKVLTVVATIFVPLTFIASLYGMNFDYIPAIHWELGFHALIAVMCVIVLAMLYFFHRKKWI